MKGLLMWRKIKKLWKWWLLNLAIASDSILQIANCTILHTKTIAERPIGFYLFAGLSSAVVLFAIYMSAKDYFWIDNTVDAEDFVAAIAASKEAKGSINTAKFREELRRYLDQ